jgi:hypothetical protein
MGPDSVEQFSRQERESTITADSGAPLRQSNGAENPPATRETQASRPPQASLPVGNPSAPTPAELQRQVDVFIDDIEFTDDPAKRRAASRLGRDVWDMNELPATLRAEAAFIVGQVLIKEAQADESKRSEARLWVQRAVDLDRRQTWVSILQGI